MKFRVSPYLAALSAVMVVLASVWVVDRTEKQLFLEHSRAEVLDELSATRGRLEASLNQRLYLTRGLEAYISASNPNITQEEFEKLMGVIVAQQPGIPSAALFKNSIATHLYPLAGQEKALGFDPIKVPGQRYAFETAIKTRRTVLSGPVHLVPLGNAAFITRTPIFLTPKGKAPESGPYWGMVSIGIDRDTLFKEAGLLDRNTKVRYAIRGKDGLGEKGEVFFGQARIFQQKPVILQVTLPNGSWQLAAIPAQGWPSVAPVSKWIWTVGSVLALLTGVLVFQWVRDPVRLREAVEQATGALKESEARYRELVENANTIILRIDSQGKITFFNEFAQRFFGYSEKEILGKNAIGTIVPQTYSYRNDIAAIGRDIIQNPERYTYNESENIRRNGERVWIAWRNKALLDEKGRFTGLLCIGSDISDRKKAEEALRQSEQRFRDVSEAAGEYIWEVDANGIYTFVTERAKSVKGYGAQELIGHTPFEFMPEEDIQKIQEILRDASSKKSAFKLEHRDVTSTGEIVWEEVNGIPLLDKNGEIVGFRGAGLSITDRKKAEEALRTSVSEAARSAAELRALFAAMNDIIVILDSQGHYLKIAPTKPGLLYKPSDELIGKTLHDVFPESADFFACQIQRALDTKQTVSIEYNLQIGKRDIWFAANISPISSDTVIVVARDISDRKRAEEALRASEAELRAFFAAMTDIILVQDSQGRYLKIAPTNPGLLYKLPADIVGKTMQEVFPSELADFFLSHFQQALETGQMVSMEYSLPIGDKEIWFAANISPIQEDSVIVVARDISDRKRAEIALQKANEELEIRVQERTSELRQAMDLLREEIVERKQAEIALRQSEARERERSSQLEQALLQLRSAQAKLIQTEKMSSLGQLVAGVAHEINNPINFIHGNLPYVNQYAQDLLDIIQLYQEEYNQINNRIKDKIEEIDLKFIQQDLSKILSSMAVGTERIRQIVVSLRNFARLDEAQMKRVNIHEGIESTLFLLQSRLKAQNGQPEIQVIKEFGNLPKIECYPGQLNQVFMNVLSNAIDAIEQQRQELPFIGVLTIRTEIIDSDKLLISIGDNGIGMSEKVQSQIFNPFFTTKAVGSGTGLGLSISYQIIVEQHRGQLYCASKVNQGTTFFIEIPISQNLPTK